MRGEQNQQTCHAGYTYQKPFFSAGQLIFHQISSSPSPARNSHILPMRRREHVLQKPVSCISAYSASAANACTRINDKEEYFMVKYSTSVHKMRQSLTEKPQHDKHVR